MKTLLQARSPAITPKGNVFDVRRSRLLIASHVVPISCTNTKCKNTLLKSSSMSLVSVSNSFTRRKRTQCKALNQNQEQDEEEAKKTKKKSSNVFDKLSNVLTNVLSGAGLKNLPTVEGDVSDLFGRPLFFALYDWFMQSGGIYKLSFGPKSFVVISDPIIARHILRENAFAYDKGVLADILEPIMGKGLIPADLDTWRVRRRAVVPAFHTAYLEAMVSVFSNCAMQAIEKINGSVSKEEEGNVAKIEMEALYSSLALDIIGISVFNYDFGSITKESPIIQAVYGTLNEAEHRSTFYFPYWKFPLSKYLVPRQVKFQNDLKIINDCMDELILRARETRQEDDLEALQNRDYSQVKDASLLRFLVDMRGEDCNDKQLRDDLMTMLIAGHETTAAVLTWATFMLAQNKEIVEQARKEIDEVLGDRVPNLEDIKKLQTVRFIVAEALRLFPQPPLLIRRSLESDLLPSGNGGNPDGYQIPQGTDIFISVYNIHRSPEFWDEPNKFNPNRFLIPKSGSHVQGWNGYDPEKMQNSLYPNETAADFAFLPFGGGPRKCLGDQFALMESTVTLALVLRRFDITLTGGPEDVELVTGATIHTKSGLWCYLKQRQDVPSVTLSDPVVA